MAHQPKNHSRIIAHVAAMGAREVSESRTNASLSYGRRRQKFMMSLMLSDGHNGSASFEAEPADSVMVSPTFAGGHLHGQCFHGRFSPQSTRSQNHAYMGKPESRQDGGYAIIQGAGADAGTHCHSTGDFGLQLTQQIKTADFDQVSFVRGERLVFYPSVDGFAGANEIRGLFPNQGHGETPYEQRDTG